MATNNEELKSLYTKITSGEILGKLESCGGVWTPISTIQYKATIEQGSDVWDVFLTNSLSKVVLDFRKNGNYMCSLTSDEEESLLELFSVLNGDSDYERDRALLENVMQIETCA
jgi:hypothetical protein